jgi:hypothetical protein
MLFVSQTCPNTKIGAAQAHLPIHYATTQLLFVQTTFSCDSINFVYSGRPTLFGPGGFLHTGPPHKAPARSAKFFRLVTLVT